MVAVAGKRKLAKVAKRKASPQRSTRQRQVPPTKLSVPQVTAEQYADQLRAEIIRRGQRIYKLTTASGITEQRAAELQSAELTVCRADFWYWLRNYAWFADPKTDDPKQLRKIPLLLWEAQERILKFLIAGLAEKRDRNLNKSREVGATWLACALLYWQSAIADDREGFVALAMSRVEDYVDDGTTNSIFGKIRFQHRMQPYFLRPVITRDSSMLLEFAGGGTIEGESTNSSAGRSGRYAVVLKDEWAFVAREKQRPIVLALESVARTVWTISTPNGQGEDFHATVEQCRKYRPQDLLEIPWTADPRRTKEWYESLLIPHGKLTWDEREQAYNCSFAAVSGMRIFRAGTNVTYSDAWLDKTYPGARKLWPSCWPMDFGSGPSWTVCGAALISWDHGQDITFPDGSKTRLPLILLDREMVWQRVPVAQIGQELMETRANYSGLAWHFGDPAGASAESDQESWESNLNAAGVPISCLPGVYNTATLRDESINEAQMMMDRGLFRVHESRAPLVKKTIELWEWAVPHGVPVEFIPRDLLKPLKNGWSHVGDACILYLVSAVLRAGREVFDSASELTGVLPMAPGAEASRMYDSLARQRSSGSVIEEDLEPEDDPLGSMGIDWK